MTANEGSGPDLEFSGSLTVRRAKAGDARALLEISADMGLGCAAADLSDHLDELLGSADNEVFVAIFDDTIAGWAHVFLARRLGAGSFAEVGGLVTSEQYRRRGIGRMLIRHCERWARRHHKTSLRVRCNVQRQGAHEFYEDSGFARTKNQVVYEKSL